jgi:hypothetical protein
MPVLDFLNETTLRDYPFQPNQTFGVTMDKSWLADANFVLGVATSFDYSIDCELTRIVGTATDVTFTFTADTVQFDFVVLRSYAPGYVVWANGRVGITTSNKYGFAYIQIGNVTSIGTGTWIGNAKIEPALVMSLGGHQATSLNIANTEPTRILDECIQYYATGDALSNSIQLFNSGSPIPAGSYKLQYAGGAMRYGSVARFRWDVGFDSTNWRFVTGASSQLAYLPYIVKTGGWKSQTECEAANAVARSSTTFGVTLASGTYGVQLFDTPFVDNLVGMPNPTWELVPVYPSSSAASSDGIALATSIITDVRGDVLLAPGRHATITLDTADDAVTFGFTDEPEEGGELPCNNIDLIYGSSGLAGPTCKDLLYTLDGVGANPDNNTFNLVGSRGIAVVPLVDGHSVRVELSPLILFKDQLPPDCTSSSGAQCVIADGFSSSPVILGPAPTGSFSSSWASWVPHTFSSSAAVLTTDRYNPRGYWKISYFSPMSVGRDCFVEGAMTNTIESYSGYARDAFLTQISGSVHGICPSNCSTFAAWPGPEFQLTTYQDPDYRAGVIGRIKFNAGYGCSGSNTKFDDAQWEARLLMFIPTSYAAVLDELYSSSSSLVFWRENQYIDGEIRWFNGSSDFNPGTYWLRYERGAYGRDVNPATGSTGYCVTGYEIIVNGINSSHIAYGPAPVNLNEPYFGWLTSDMAERANVGLAERVENLVKGPIGMRLSKEFASDNSPKTPMQTPRFIVYPQNPFIF